MPQHAKSREEVLPGARRSKQVALKGNNPTHNEKLVGPTHLNWLQITFHGPKDDQKRTNTTQGRPLTKKNRTFTTIGPSIP